MGGVSSFTRIARGTVAGVLVGLVVAAGAAGQSPATSPITVEGAWARTSPMIERAGAAYMVIRNAGATDDALIGASSSASAVVEIHQTTADPSGVMMMAPVGMIPVPAGGEAVLEPGGYHIMLIDLVAPLEEGATVDLRLSFQSGLTLDVAAEVRAMMPMGSPMASPAAM
jgi:copper(I)-binding protein